MSSLQHLGGDRWLVRVADGTKPNGQPWQKSRTIRAKTQRDAARRRDRVAADLRAELAATKERVRVESDPTAITVERLTHMWIDAKRHEGRASATITQYETNAARWNLGIGARLAVDLTPLDVDLWLRDLTVTDRDGKPRPAAASTKRQVVKDLGSMLKFGAAKFPGRLPTPPVTAAVTLPAHRAKRQTVPDIDVLRDAVPMMLEQGPVGIAGALAFGAGLRQGEACALRWTSIRKGRIHVTQAVKRSGPLLDAPKRESVRQIPLSSVASDALAAASDWVAGTSQARSEWVLPSVRVDGPLRPMSVAHGWPAVAARCGLEGVTFHGLRHACGSLLLHEGVPITKVSAALGHANVAITMRIYAHVLGELGDDLFDGFDQALGAGSSAP